MNTVNNRRRRDSREKIQKAFINLLQDRQMKDITVSDLIKATGLNRSTFYANYLDIYDLADKTRQMLEKDFSALFADYDYMNARDGAEKMFAHIKENQLFYTKGDANKTEDGAPVHFKNLIGKPIFKIPILGYVAYFIQHPPGTYIAIVAGAILLILVFLPDVLNSYKKKNKQPLRDETNNS